MWFDSHAHPTSAELDAEFDTIDVQGIGGFVAVGTSVTSSAEMVDLVAVGRQRRPDLVLGAAVGVHPHDAKDFTTADALEALIEDHPNLIWGVGECGLDLFYEYSDRASQEYAFRAQIALAKRFDLTLVVHTRDAWEDTFRIFDDEGMPNRVIMHCFVGGPREAARSLDYGAYLSFSGIATFKNAEDVRQAFLSAPLERVLVETDAPYLAPVPLRGRPNLIGNVAITGRFLAELRGLAPAEFADVTWQNTIEAFRIL